MRRPLGVALFAALVLLPGCSGDDDGDVEAFCAQLADSATIAGVFDQTDLTDVAATKVQLQAAITVEEALRSDAPPELRDEIDLLLQLLRDLDEGLDAIDPADTRAAAELYNRPDIEAQFPAVGEASVALAKYQMRACAEFVPSTVAPTSTAPTVPASSPATEP